MKLKFYVGWLYIKIAKNRLLGGYYFEFKILFYGRGYYAWKKKMEKFKSQLPSAKADGL
ncbi:MAG: hypothetical protein Q7J67_00560 [bacterium]|nr:hypothetical protein [bacterium]